MHLMSCPSIVFRKPSIHKCPFVCQHMKCWHSDGEVPFGLITTGTTSPGKTQNSIILYSLGYYWPDLQWSLYLMNIWWPNAVVTSRRRNKTSSLGYNSKIHLEYSSKLQYFNSYDIEGEYNMCLLSFLTRNSYCLIFCFQNPSMCIMQKRNPFNIASS